MRNSSIKTLSVTLFLFTLYANGGYIYYYISCNQPFVTSNVESMAQVLIAFTTIASSFYFPKYFWAICIAYFASFPISIFIVSRWFPDVVYVVDIMKPLNAPDQNLGVPVLLMLLSIIVYALIYRKENAV